MKRKQLKIQKIISQVLFCAAIYYWILQTDWKLAEVTAVHKKVSESDSGNCLSLMKVYSMHALFYYSCGYSSVTRSYKYNI